MSLRLRLLLSLGLALSVQWGAVAMWMLRDVDREMRRTLDQRLAMSARMVASLMSQNPASWQGRTSAAGAPALALALSDSAKGIACQVSSLHGEVYARTGTAAGGLSVAAPGFAELEIDGERWRSFTVEALGLRVTTADRLAERSTLLREVAFAAALPFVVALTGGLLMLWLCVRSGLLPLERLREALARRAPETLTPIDSPMPAELQPLVATLNQLLERTAATLARERRFTSDAAHELRTPLTAIKTHLQVARISRGGEADAALGHALEGTDRLQHTLEQLLTLSQVEGAFSWDEGVVARAGEVARLAVLDAAPETPGRIVVRTGDSQACELGLPQALAVTALRNLLDNALRHSPAAQPVELRIGSTAERVCFTVCDRGPGLDGEQLALASQRFWRRGAGRGSGLGLSIVAAITERFGGSFDLLERDGGGLEARLELLRLRTAEIAP